MIFRVTLKDTDVLQDALEEAVLEDLKNTGFSDEEKDAIKVIREQNAAEVASKWFEYGEYLTVEINTDKNTCVVIPIDEDN